RRHVRRRDGDRRKVCNARYATQASLNLGRSSALRRYDQEIAVKATHSCVSQVSQRLADVIDKPALEADAIPALEPQLTVVNNVPSRHATSGRIITHSHDG